MEIYIFDADEKIIKIDAGDVANLDQFERDLNDVYGEDGWAYDELDLALNSFDVDSRNRFVLPINDNPIGSNPFMTGEYDG